MRQILILRGTKNREVTIVNLPENDTYQVSFKAIADPFSESKNVSGLLSISYAYKETEIKMTFTDMQDAREFEQAFVEYMMNASMPVVVEGDKHEIRYWMEFEVLEVCDA